MMPPLGRWDDLPRGEHHRDEPPHGLMMRLATRHRKSSADKFAEGFGIEVTDVAACMEVLASYEHVDAYPEQLECLRSWVPVTFARDGLQSRLRTIGGQEVRMGDWSVATRRFCPACLAEAPYHRAWFDLLFMRTCPDHGLPIVDTTEDGVAVGFSTASIDVTSTGARLSRGAPRLRVQRDSIEAYALGRLGLRDCRELPLLDGMRLGEAVATCEMMGDAIFGGWRPTRPTPGDVGRERGEVVDAGFAVLAAGREAVVSAFKEIGRGSSTRTYGARKLFGWLYDWFAFWPGTHVVRDLLMDAAHELGQAGRRNSDRRSGQAAYVTLSEVAKDHGLRRHSVWTVAKGLEYLQPSQGPGTPLVIARHDVSTVVTAFRMGMRRPKAAEVLGISMETMDWLVSTGHIACSWRGLDGDTAERFHFGDLLGFVESLPFEFVAEEDWLAHVPLPSVLDRARHLDLDVLSEAWGGRIKLFAKSSVTDSLANFTVSADETALRDLGLPLLAATWARRISRAPVTAMTRREACAVLGVSPETVAALLDAGHLSLVGAKGRESKRTLDRDAVARFRERYLAGRYYADALGVRVRTLAKTASEAGVMDLLRDAREANGRSDVAVMYERVAMTALLGLPRDPDLDLPGHLAWSRFATHLGRGRSGYMVWTTHGEREATCAMNNMRWKVRLTVGPAADDRTCAVSATLSLTKTDKVDVGAVAAATVTRQRPIGLTFWLDVGKGHLDATLVTTVPGWGADGKAEVTTSEEKTFDAMMRVLLDLRAYFDVGLH